MNQPRKPRAFSVTSDATEPTKKRSSKTVQKTRIPRAVPPSPKLNYSQTDEDFFATEETRELEMIAPPPKVRLKKRKFSFGRLALAALGFLITASIGLWAEGLVRELMAQNIWLGRAALAATIVFVIGVFLFAVREIYGIWKLRAVNGLRDRITNALESNNNKNINKVAAELESHFEDHPKTAHARTILAQNKNEVMDAHDRFALTERELMAGLDREATQIVMNAAKRVSVVTAVSPRAIVDVGYVLYENIRLIRVLCEHYGGRTGMFGTIALTRNVVAHLAVTGSIAIGDGIIQQLLGHGIAARLSARLGEGVVNGLMTARVGLSAIDVCRPSPFHALPRPKITDFASNLLKFSASKAKTDT